MPQRREFAGFMPSAFCGSSGPGPTGSVLSGLPFFLFIQISVKQSATQITGIQKIKPKAVAVESIMTPETT
jgi:hypothetical protein